MAQINSFPQNADRYDPYKNYRFRVKWDSAGSAVYVAGISKVSGLKRTTEVVTHREGGDASTSRKSPGRTEFEAITLERGVTHDSAFEEWANQVWKYGNWKADGDLGGKEIALKNFRKDITIEMYNEAGSLVISYYVFRCWVSEYQALPELDANGNAIAIQTLKLENEGWERAKVDLKDEPEIAGAEMLGGTA